MAKAHDSYFSGLLMLGCVVLFTLLALNQQRPPAAVGADASASEFSSGRALKHVEVIARAPHELGSAEHAAVRDYILRELSAAGVSPEIQKTTVVTTRRGSPTAATVENIVARLGGTDGGKAVVLVSHYDSVSNSPGASDDGSGVAALLETLRALKASAPLKRDVILLFTDGEENGLLGATAFVSEHPWAKDAGVVLNFEARGNSGPSIMFETSPQNGWLIDEFAEAAPHPVANSLSYEIYKLLPNDTDFTILREAGMPGLNFAFIEGLTHYHTQIDSVNNLDERSLQHHGASALALARHFGALEGVGRTERNAVYFNVPGSLVIRYSSVWITPLIVLVTAVFAAVMVYGLRKKQLSVGGIVFGFIACLLTIVVATSVAYVLWYLISVSNPAYGRMPFGDTYNSRFYLLGFTALTVTIVATLYSLLRRKLSAANLMFGGSACWLILLVVSGLLLPGGSYIFTWPLLFSLFGLAASFALRKDEGLPLRLAVLLALCALPGVVLLVPLIGAIFTALTVTLVWVTVILTVLLLWLLIPILDFLITRHGWLLSAVALAVSFIFIGLGGLAAGFNKQHPQPFHLIYGLDANAAQAIWASAEGMPDKWAAQFFPAGAERATLGQFYYNNPRPFLVTPAPLVALPTPVVTLVNNDRMESGGRRLRLRVEAPENETSIFINVSSEAETVRASVNGKEIKSDGAGGGFEFGADWGIRYYAPEAGGLELLLEMASGAPVKVHVVGVSSGLPDVPNTPVKNRPDDVMPAPYLNSSSTLVAKTFSFN